MYLGPSSLVTLEISGAIAQNIWRSKSSIPRHMVAPKPVEKGAETPIHLQREIRPRLAKLSVSPNQTPALLARQAITPQAA